MSSEALQGSSFCSLARNGLADIPAEMRALYEYQKINRIAGGWRRIGDLLGVSGAYARQLAYGEKKLTPALIRMWLISTHGIQDMVLVATCPDCGAVHTGRCHGREVKVVPVGKPRARRRYFRPCLPVELRGAYEQWRSEQA